LKSCRSVSAGRRFSGGVGIFCGFLGGSCWYRLGGLFLLEVNDRGGEGLFLRKYREAEGGQHEHHSHDHCKLAQEIGRTSAAEDGLTRSSEGGADFSSLARLQENGSYHEETSDDMNDDDECVHGTPV